LILSTVKQVILESCSTLGAIFSILLSILISSFSAISLHPFKALLTSLSSTLLSFRVFLLASIFFQSPFTVIRIVSGFLVGVLTIVCGFSRGRFLLFTSLIASEQDEDIERKDSLLTTSFSGGFATIFVFFGSVLVICDDALFAGDFSWALDLLFIAVSCSGRCSDVFRNTSCSLSETALRDLSTGRFCLLVDEIVELFTTVPNESILVCTPLVSFSLCFCKTFLTSTGEESSCDLLSLLQDCSCSFFVKRSFSLFAVERGSDFILSRDFCLILVAEIACLDGTFTAVSLSSFTEDSRIFFDAGDVEEQT